MTLTVADLMKALDTTLDDKAAHIDRVHRSHWEARSQVVQSLVSVGSAIFAGTVTFLNASPLSTCSVDGWLLISSWVLLILSISSGLYVLWQSVTLRSFYPKLFNNRPVIRKQFEALDFSAPAAADNSAAILKTVVDNVVVPMGRADLRAQCASRVCLGSFFLSMLCFLAFAVWRVAGI